jgi:NAD(P)-dependent dehydrogenase (short-subunit alcohol dehydrogenase family)
VGHLASEPLNSRVVGKPEAIRVRHQAVYSGTTFGVRATSEGLRQEVGDKLRVTIISPGFVKTPFVDAVANAEVTCFRCSSRGFSLSSDRFALGLH